ncbi:hypothetical protein, partial [Frankia sp. AvcI1]|uniref:hypothetical protein n=1 Tax=Frankia sp. AvcI1 TaxID=573496 RepID=UPI001F1AB5F2
MAVRAEIGNLAYHEPVPGIEMESGTETSHTLGGNIDSRNRDVVLFPEKVKLDGPHLNINATAAYNRDKSTSHAGFGGGRTVAKGKTVEEGAHFKGPVRFVVSYDLRRLGFPLRRGPRTVTIPDASVIFPMRDTRTGAAGQPPVDRTPATAFAPPSRIRQTRRLGSSDIVQDLRGLPALPGDRLRGMDDILRHVDGEGRRVFGHRWNAAKKRIEKEVPLVRLQYDLRSMTAGDPIEVAVPG